MDENTRQELLRHMAPNHAKPEHIKAVVDRAKELLHRSKVVNKAQYAHGINSSSAQVDYLLRKMDKRGGGGTYAHLDDLGKATMQLGGYLYALKENL